MDPVTLAVIGTATSVLGTVTSGIASYNQQKSQAAIAQQQMKIEEENARRARFKAQVEQQDQDLLARIQLGEQFAGQSASGLSVGSRSFLAQRKSSQELARRDALNIRQGGELDAFNFNMAARDAEYQRNQAKVGARNALFSTALGVGGDLIGGATKVNKIKADRVVGGRKS